MDVNDYAYILNKRVVLEFIASARASTGCAYTCGLISLTERHCGVSCTGALSFDRSRAWERSSVYNTCQPPPKALYRAMLACTLANRSCTFRSWAAYSVRWVSSTLSRSSAPAW